MATIYLKLRSQEDETFEVESDVACKSQLIKNMVEGSENDEEISLPNVKSKVLSKVIDFCRNYRNSDPPAIEKPLKSANMLEVVSPWDAGFIELEQEMLFELILAAHYLDIRSLLDLSCAKVASMIKGRSVEEIRRTFNIENDFTPEEEAQVREENRWAEEA
jgi:S-phase kinase-associated protein 1